MYIRHRCQFSVYRIFGQRFHHLTTTIYTFIYLDFFLSVSLHLLLLLLLNVYVC